MTIKHDIDLTDFTSFAVQTKTDTLIEIDSIEQLPNIRSIIKHSNYCFYILGQGTNTLFVDDIAPLILLNNIKGVSVSRDSVTGDFLIKCGAGERWHDIVKYCINHEMPGLENLAYIPGTVGAAPIQNIGAYGSEFSEFCEYVEWFDFSNNILRKLANPDCQFGYRDSVFKHKLYNKGIVTGVLLRLPVRWCANLNYRELKQFSDDVDASTIYHFIKKIRKQKIPDFTQFPNAGSFFKNPIISNTQFNDLLNSYKEIPHYPVDNTHTKLPAGWLIEKAGLKGIVRNGVATDKNQALVIINPERKSGNEVLSFAQYIQRKIYAKFNIYLEPEVRLIGAKGAVEIQQSEIFDNE